MKTSKIVQSLIVLFLLLHGYPTVYAQHQRALVCDSSNHIFHFRFNTIDFEQMYMENSSAMQQLDSLVTNATFLSAKDTIKITGSASPDGKYSYNQELAQARAESFKQRLLSLYPLLRKATIVTDSYVLDWVILNNLLQADQGLPHKSEVLTILNLKRDISAKSWILKNLKGGDSWKYITDKYLRYLPTGEVSIMFSIKQASLNSVDSRVITSLQDSVSSAIDPLSQSSVSALSKSTDGCLQPDTVSARSTQDVQSATVLVSEDRRNREHIAPTEISPPFYMSVKSNLLYDGVLVPNLGLEFYLSSGWSLGANYAHAWWSDGDSHKYWRLYGGELYARKWFGGRSEFKPLTGHHAGIYAQVGSYDLSRGNRGEIGKLNYGLGLEYGYSQPIANRLNLDFSIGLGYLGGTYESYKPVGGQYIWQETLNRSYFGPTKVEISLVWLIGRGNKNKR